MTDEGLNTQPVPPTIAQITRAQTPIAERSPTVALQTSTSKAP